MYSDALATTEDLIRPVLDDYATATAVTLALTTRVKTTTTIRQKLEREAHMGMKGMQDIAGVRITGSLDRREQDDLGEILMRTFATEGRPPKRIDRRQSPSHGYRALHLVVHVDDLPVEVQIRTALQNSWAQLVERLADLWGRGLRYGSAPDEPDRIAFGTITRAALLSTLMQASDQIDRYERQLAGAGAEEQELMQLEAQLEEDPTLSEVNVAALRDRVAELRMRARSQVTENQERLDALRHMLESLGDITDEGADS